jgi:hypothetical protein
MTLGHGDDEHQVAWWWLWVMEMMSIMCALSSFYGGLNWSSYVLLSDVMWCCQLCCSLFWCILGVLYCIDVCVVSLCLFSLLFDWLLEEYWLPMIMCLKEVFRRTWFVCFGSLGDACLTWEKEEIKDNSLSRVLVVVPIWCGCSGRPTTGPVATKRFNKMTT